MYCLIICIQGIFEFSYREILRCYLGTYSGYGFFFNVRCFFFHFMVCSTLIVFSVRFKWRKTKGLSGVKERLTHEHSMLSIDAVLTNLWEVNTLILTLQRRKIRPEEVRELTQGPTDNEGESEDFIRGCKGLMGFFFLCVVFFACCLCLCATSSNTPKQNQLKHHAIVFREKKRGWIIKAVH